MSSRELVKKTIEFNNPERIVRQLWTLPWAEIKYPEMIETIQREYPDDIVQAPPFYQRDLLEKGDRYKIGEFIDEWGCKFVNLQEGVHGEVKEPLIGDWSELNNVHIPEERLSIDIDKINEFCNKTDKFVLPDTLQRPFERLQFIRRTDNLMIDLMDQPNEFKKLLYMIHEFYCEEIKIWCKTDIDGIFLMDDWGAQEALLINPNLWKEIFRPLYQEYINIAHENNKYVFMHSDGHIEAIIPELIEMGLDALNSQLFCMDIEKIGRKYAGQITFWGEIDRQHLLPHGRLEDINIAVERVFNSLYKDGGVIAQCEFGPGAKPENVLQVYKSWDSISL